MSKNSNIRTLQQSHDPEYKDEEGAENFILCDYIDVPLVEPEMIFSDLWPARTIGLFTGDGGIGKTHLTLQLLVLIASGGEIDGTPFQCTTPRPVIYISQEDEGAFLIAELRAQIRADGVAILHEGKKDGIGSGRETTLRLRGYDQRCRHQQHA